MIKTTTVTISIRKDGKKRYRICLPKKIGDKEDIIKGEFTYIPEKKMIVFET